MLKCVPKEYYTQLSCRVQCASDDLTDLIDCVVPCVSSWLVCALWIDSGMAGRSGACPPSSTWHREQAFQFRGKLMIYTLCIFCHWNLIIAVIWLISYWTNFYVLVGPSLSQDCLLLNNCLWTSSQMVCCHWQAELQKMRVEMAGMKREAEHYSRQVSCFLRIFAFLMRV